MNKSFGGLEHSHNFEKFDGRQKKKKGRNGRSKQRKIKINFKLD